MIFHDFPRILLKSGVYLIQPPKLCARLLGGAGGLGARARARGARAQPLGRDAGIAPTTTEEMRKPHGLALWGGLGNTFGHWNMSPQELFDKIVLLAAPQRVSF